MVRSAAAVAVRFTKPFNFPDQRVASLLEMSVKRGLLGPDYTERSPWRRMISSTSPHAVASSAFIVRR